MVYNYEYNNNLKIKIWINELSVQECDSINIIKRKYKANGQVLNNDKQIAVELQIPRNVSNYGMLGVKYQKNLSSADIIINVNEYEEEIYEDNMSIKPDVVHKGIPEDYIGGIIKCIEKNNESSLLKCGIYEFNVGTHGEVGSSEKLFYIITNILLKLLYQNSIDKDVVKEIIDSEIF